MINDRNRSAAIKRLMKYDKRDAYRYQITNYSPLYPYAFIGGAGAVYIEYDEPLDFETIDSRPYCDEIHISPDLLYSSTIDKLKKEGEFLNLETIKEFIKVYKDNGIKKPYVIKINGIYYNLELIKDAMIAAKITIARTYFDSNNKLSPVEIDGFYGSVACIMPLRCTYDIENQYKKLNACREMLHI